MSIRTQANPEAARAAPARATLAGADLMPHAAALLLYLGLAILVTWPLAANALTGVVGSDEAVDSYQHIWHQWWVADALTHAKNPFFTDLLYYPEGIDLFWQTLGFSQGLVALPVTLTLGPVAGVNFTVLSSFVIGGYAVFLLARRLSGSLPGALVAGTIYAFSPYHLQKMTEGSIELTSIHWLPLYVWSLAALLERPRWWRALLAGLLLLWVSLGAWYYGLFAVMLTGVMALVWAVAQSRETAGPRDHRTAEQGTKGRGTREQGNKLPTATHRPSSIVPPADTPSPITHRPSSESPPADTPPSSIVHRLSSFVSRWLDIRTLLWGAAPLLIWALILAPKIATVNQSVDQSSWDMREAQVTHSADLIDFVLPSPIHPLWGAAVREWRTARFPDLLTYWNVSLGLVGLPLALLGLATAWRRSWRWGALLLATMVLAMGPMLRLSGLQTGIPMPFALIQGLPGVRIGQRPSHMAVLAILMVALLAAFGVARLVRGRSARTGLILAGALAAAVVLVDGSVERERLAIWSRTTHPFYTSLPPADGALMALPMYVNVNRIDHMNNQIVHRWPIFAGYVARPPAYRFAYETDGVSQIREGRAEPDDIVTPGWPESGRRALAAYRIRYVALDLTTMRGEPKLAAGKPEYFAAVRDLLGQLGVGAPIVADADLEAYSIPRDWPVGPVGSLGEGWLALERQPEAGLRWRWMGERSTIRLHNPGERPVAATVRLRLASYQRPRDLRLSIDGSPLGAIPVTADPGTRSITFVLPPGTHILELAAEADPDPDAGGQPISVRAFWVGFTFANPER